MPEFRPAIVREIIDGDRSGYQVIDIGDWDGCRILFIDLVYDRYQLRDEVREVKRCMQNAGQPIPAEIIRVLEGDE